MTPGATADGAAQFPVSESRSVRALSSCMDRAGGQRPPYKGPVRTRNRPTRPGIEPTVTELIFVKARVQFEPTVIRNEICESAVLNDRAINATNTVRNDN
jgi:hypothetical protein